MRNLVVVAERGWLAHETKGQDLLEYSLLISLIATFVIGALTLTGKQINEVLWGYIASINW